MSDLNNTVTAAGFPRVKGPTFLFSSTLNAHLAQSMDEAASRGELTRFLTVPMIGAGMAPAGVAVIGSPFIMAAPHLNAVATNTLIPAANGVINSHYGQVAQKAATQYTSISYFSTGLANILKGINAVNNAYSYKSESLE